MSSNPTRVLNQTLVLGDNPDTIRYVVEGGHPAIVLDHISIALDLTSQAALDKLAAVVAQAAAEQGARSLKAVA